MSAAANTLLIVSDEHNPWVMGYMGHPCVRTPNLDALAARGTAFTRAWSNSPLCVPARASLATGQYVHRHRCWDNAIAYRGDSPSWMQRLSANGVQVDAIGKLHFRSASDPVGFRRQIDCVHIENGVGQVWGSVRNPLPETSSPSGMFNKLGAGESAYNRYDCGVRDSAVRWLFDQAVASEPWVLFVGLVAPHFPLVVPDVYLQRVLDDPGLDACLPQDMPDHHPWVARMVAYMDHDAALGSAQRRRLAVAAYLALVEFMDALVGDILGALEQTGLAASTRVIYTSDHGDNLGARRLWNKGTLYRESAGIPLILAGPDVPAGKRCSTNVSLVDLYPTLLHAQGMTLDEDGLLPGASLLDLAQAQDDPARVVFSEYHGVGSPTGAYLVADGRYVYHYYVGYPPELFDVEADPHELHDLAADPRHAYTLARMHGALSAIVDPDSADRCARGDQDALVASYGGPEQALHTGHRGATSLPKPATAVSCEPLP